jgi:GntR family transcriptional regulator, transcriptional repressor for pyruvate dehydrogenase complex
VLSRISYERVAEQIVEFIAESRLTPGDRLPTETELAGRLRGLFVADDEGMLTASR